MDLDPSLDLRLPQYRREIFLRFYLWSLKHRTWPGGVYYLLPWLADHYGWTEEQKLWFAFLNGNTQNPVTSLILMQRCDRPTGDVEGMILFFEDRWERLPFDTDRRHQKGNFPAAVRGYLSRLNHRRDQRAYWRGAANGGWPHMWAMASSLFGFGRLSAFSYLEYLWIYGYGAPCGDLMLADREGSRSHRTGLEIVSGADPAMALANRGPVDQGSVRHLDSFARDLLEEAEHRTLSAPFTATWPRDVGRFTLESALCTYKSWHKPNRRYPGVYEDMLYNRIRSAQESWPDLVDTQGTAIGNIFWRARAECLPQWLRLESSPFDPGLCPDKQNHYRLTGQTVTMGHDDPQLWSAFDQAVADGRFGVRVDSRKMRL
jgi:hypothetical protein